MTQPNAYLISRIPGLLMGLAGILGGLVMFAGDMLFYYNGEQRDLYAGMAQASFGRIVGSGLCAVVGGWLYTLGAGHLYYAFQPARRWVRLTTFASFAMVMIAMGVIHGAYVALATSAQNAVQFGLAPDALKQLALTTNNSMRAVGFIPFGVFAACFLSSVWEKRTLYPRWMLLFCPLLPMFIARLVTGSLGGELRAIVSGGYFNLIFVLFFSASTLALALAPKGGVNP
jgi:hypothetical protein